MDLKSDFKTSYPAPQTRTSWDDQNQPPKSLVISAAEGLVFLPVWRWACFLPYYILYSSILDYPSSCPNPQLKNNFKQSLSLVCTMYHLYWHFSSLVFYFYNSGMDMLIQLLMCSWVVYITKGNACDHALNYRLGEDRVPPTHHWATNLLYNVFTWRDDNSKWKDQSLWDKRRWD